MQEFVNMWGQMLNDVSAFLLTDPMIWFVGVFLLLAIVRLFKYITSSN